MRSGNFDKQLQEAFRAKGVCEEKIDEVLDSGYMLMNFMTSFKGDASLRVLDKMYGSKGVSSCFDVDEFIEYIHGEREFSKLPPFVEYIVRNIEDINEILQDERRQQYAKNGLLSFRGQTSEYTYKRKIPSPVRANEFGREISIFPGLFRQSGEIYSFDDLPEERRTLKYFLHELEPNNPNIHSDSMFAYDIMRIEQHYATQTSGLDISFDIETAIFFATYRFRFNKYNRAYHEKVKKGDHAGVIYGFRFMDPPVKSSEFLITDFDFFKTHRPERIIRQCCGLPLFGEYERNIATCDLDFIIRLDKDFDYEGLRTPEYMFPNVQEDAFYGKLLELKDRHPEYLSNIVEYENSRGRSVP